MNVKVLDAPEMPGGPIEILSLCANRCKISWKPPHEDGGADVTNYVIEKRETCHLAWVLVNANVTTTTHEICKFGQYLRIDEIY